MDRIDRIEYYIDGIENIYRQNRIDKYADI